jgi:hypothetical protein
MLYNRQSTIAKNPVTLKEWRAGFFVLPVPKAPKKASDSDTALAVITRSKKEINAATCEGKRQVLREGIIDFQGIRKTHNRWESSLN